MFKKFLFTSLAAVLALGAIGCSTKSAENANTPAPAQQTAETTKAPVTEEPATEAPTKEPATEAPATGAPVIDGIVINYPENMKKLGYTDAVELEKMPERVVCMSTTPVLALNRLGVNMIAVPKSAVVQWPENMKDAALLQLAHNENFDIETVVAMEPDLVILGYTSQDTYGKVLEGVNIPVYYVDAGHTVSYDSIKAQTEVLIEAFGSENPEGAEILKLFTDLEAKLDETKKALEGKTVMVLQSSPPSHYIQTKGGTLGSMAEMIGLTNVYENDKTFMAPIDFETALELDPDLVLCVGMSPTAEGHQKLMEEDFKNNPDYWNSIKAIADGNIIYLPVQYVSSAGINVVDNINSLADIITAHFAG